MSNIDFQNGLAAGLSCGANIAKEVNDFITKLPPTVGDLNESVSSSDATFKLSEVALIEIDNQLAASCDNDVWNLPLGNYCLGLKAKAADGTDKGGKYIRATELIEETVNGEKIRKMKAGLATIKFFTGGAYNTTYLTFDRLDIISSKELVEGDIITLILMEVK